MQKNKSLLDVAKANLKVSRTILSAYEDDLSINLAAYHAQQAVEKTLKFRINMIGEKYPMTHDIEQLANILFKAGQEVPEWLEKDAARISEYENKTRYVMGFTTSKKSIESLLNNTEELIKGCEPVIYGDNNA